MILGAGYAQVPLYRAANKLGYRTAACSIAGNYPGLALADEVIEADITDPDAVIRGAAAAGIAGAATCCMDLGTLALGAVCDTLYLPGPSRDTALAASDKSVEKEIYRRHGIPAAAHRVVRTAAEVREALSEIGFPAMIKAVDLTGSRGVRRVETPEEAEAAFESAMHETARDFCIVEEFLSGTMFGIEAMADAEGAMVYCLPMDNEMKGGNPSFPVGHTVPWSRPDLTQQAENLAESVIRAMGIRSCAVDLDCMLVENTMYVIEATCRAGATCISETTGLHFGIDYYEALVKLAMGEDVRPMFSLPRDLRRPAVSHLLAAPSAGILRRIECPAELPEAVADLSFCVREGDTLRPMENGRDRIGQIIVTGEDAGTCRKTMQCVMDEIRIVYEDGRREKIC